MRRGFHDECVVAEEGHSLLDDGRINGICVLVVRKGGKVIFLVVRLPIISLDGLVFIEVVDECPLRFSSLSDNTRFLGGALIGLDGPFVSKIEFILVTECFVCLR